MDKIKDTGEQLENGYQIASAHRQLVDAQYWRLKAGCELLSGSDRVLMEMHLRDDANYTYIAKLLGKSRSAVTARIHRLTLAILTIESHARLKRAIAADEAAMVRMAFIQGLSIQKIALKTGMSCYRIRKLCKKMGLTSRTAKRRISA